MNTLMDALRGGEDGSGRRDVECFNVRVIDGSLIFELRGELSESRVIYKKLTYSIFRDKNVIATVGTA